MLPSSPFDFDHNRRPHHYFDILIIVVVIVILMIKLRRPTAARLHSADLGAESDEGIVNFLNSVFELCRCAEDDDDMMVNMIIMMMMNGTNGQRNCQLSDLR